MISESINKINTLVVCPWYKKKETLVFTFEILLILLSSNVNPIIIIEIQYIGKRLVNSNFLLGHIDTINNSKIITPPKKINIKKKKYQDLKFKPSITDLKILWVKRIKAKEIGLLNLNNNKELINISTPIVIH